MYLFKCETDNDNTFIMKLPYLTGVGFCTWAESQETPVNQEKVN